MTDPALCICPGCAARLPMKDGPVHPYMDSSSACVALFNEILAAEYSDPALLATHRLSVDTYAVQHTGQSQSRRQIQSVGLHLARLGLQLGNALPPKVTNDVMLGLGRFKQSLVYLDPPETFTMTVADVAPYAGTADHPDKVRQWAMQTWQDWSAHHDYIRLWAAERL